MPINFYFHVAIISSYPSYQRKEKKNNKYNFIIYTSSTSPTIQLSSCKTTHCSKYHVAINPQILPIPLRCSIKPPPSHVPQIPIHPRSTQSTSYSSTSRCISTPTPSYHVERIPTPVPSLFSFFSQRYEASARRRQEAESEKGNGERKEVRKEVRKEGCKWCWWGFWLYRLKGVRCKKRVVGPAAKVSSRGQGGGTVFSWPPGIKERRSTGASTNYYCTLPPGRRQGRRRYDPLLSTRIVVVRRRACVSRCPFLFPVSRSSMD